MRIPPFEKKKIHPMLTGDDLFGQSKKTRFWDHEIVRNPLVMSIAIEAMAQSK